MPLRKLHAEVLQPNQSPCRAQDLKRRQEAERALREERAFMTRPRDPGRPHTVPRPFALHGSVHPVSVHQLAPARFKRRAYLTKPWVPGCRCIARHPETAE